MNTNRLAHAANEARGLAMDAVHACNSGHLGLPLGCAEIGAVLFGEALRYYPDAPKWLNRDRFILSAGHGSMFLYAWLNIAGYGVSRDDVKKFRQLDSITPGHPEFHETPGVEATTGPLGQGVGNAVGYALSGKRAAALYNTSDHTIIDHHVFAICGDGCLQEGVAKESIAFAGHSGLDNLILIYDSNDVTLDAMAVITQGEDAEKYFESQRWDAVTIDGHNLAAIAEAIENAKANNNGRPKVIIAKTIIGKGIFEVQGTSKGHGEGGAKFVDTARPGLGLPADEHFYVSPETIAYFSEKKAASKLVFEAWQATYDAWSKANPELAAQLTAGIANSVPVDLSAKIPAFPADYKDATRSAGSTVINAVSKAMPQFLTGSADLFGSTKNYIKDGGDFAESNFVGKNIWFGIREHGMGAICNGIAYDGLFRASGATFLVFADYMRGSIRLASLSGLPVTYIFTHDSVGVGEDGPTHQPVETVSGLRVIPNLDVVRPGDAEETAGAFIAAMNRTDGPTALILTRQAIPLMNELSVEARRDGVLRGGYIARKETVALTTILLASGSELQHAMAAASELGAGVRVVSMPCFERFDRQSAAYREEVLPKAVTKRVSIEAGVSGLWWKYVGTEGKALGIDRFGLSAPGDVVMKMLGMTKEAVIAAAK
jgi:transketolase